MLFGLGWTGAPLASEEIAHRTSEVNGTYFSRSLVPHSRGLLLTRPDQGLAPNISRRILSRKLREYQINVPGRTKNTSLGAIRLGTAEILPGKSAVSGDSERQALILHMMSEAA